MSSQRRAPASFLAAAIFLAAFTAVAPAAAVTDPALAPVQAHLDRGEGAQALQLLRQIMKGKPTAEQLLLRSTAQIMVGEAKEGFDDLERALKLDPTLRQGWLNLAGLEIAEGHYQGAYDALLKAQALDPEADDNHLNLGAVRLFQGELGDAAAHFAKYLERNASSAEAYYLVASNYALAGHEAEAVDHLRRAVGIDEHLRLRARSDERFLGLSGSAYRQLLSTDYYEPPAGYLKASAAFREPYQRNDPQLVYAVLEALKESGIEYEPKVEATDNWALVWGTMRIKVWNQPNGTSAVAASAPPDRFTADEWQRQTQALFRGIYAKLKQAELLRQPVGRRDGG